jgi:hypothetical protein
MTVAPHPQLRIELKGSHFDTTGVIEAELQAVLNTLTEHCFQDSFKEMAKGSEWCMYTGGDYFEGDGDE